MPPPQAPAPPPRLSPHTHPFSSSTVETSGLCGLMSSWSGSACRQLTIQRLGAGQLRSRLHPGGATPPAVARHSALPAACRPPRSQCTTRGGRILGRLEAGTAGEAPDRHSASLQPPMAGAAPGPLPSVRPAWDVVVLLCAPPAGQAAAGVPWALRHPPFGSGALGGPARSCLPKCALPSRAVSCRRAGAPCLGEWRRQRGAAERGAWGNSEGSSPSPQARLHYRHGGACTYESVRHATWRTSDCAPLSLHRSATCRPIRPCSSPNLQGLC